MILLLLLFQNYYYHYLVLLFYSYHYYYCYYYNNNKHNNNNNNNTYLYYSCSCALCFHNTSQVRGYITMSIIAALAAGALTVMYSVAASLENGHYYYYDPVCQPGGFNTHTHGCSGSVSMGRCLARINNFKRIKKNREQEEEPFVCIGVRENCRLWGGGGGGG